ncbi:MAG: hypothetical protein PHO00_04965 [bacterium]|nr:hypothetical protein [bacterium]
MKKIFSRRTALFIFAASTIFFLFRSSVLKFLIKPIFEWRVSAALMLDIKIDNISGGVTQGLRFENMKVEGRYRNYNILIKTADIKSDLTLFSLLFPGDTARSIEIFKPVVHIMRAPFESVKEKGKSGVSPEIFNTGVLHKSDIRLKVSGGDVSVFNTDGSLKIRAVNIKGEFNSGPRDSAELGMSGEFGSDGSGGTVSVKSIIDIKRRSMATNVGIQGYRLSLFPRVFEYIELSDGTLNADMEFLNDRMMKGIWLFDGVSGKFLKGTEDFYGLSGKIDVDRKNLTITDTQGYVRGGQFSFRGALNRGDIPSVDGSLTIDKGRASALVNFRGALNELFIEGFHGVRRADSFTENMSFSVAVSDAKMSDDGLRISVTDGKFKLQDNEKGKISGNITAEIGHLAFNNLSVNDRVFISGNIYYSENPEFKITAEVKNTQVRDIKKIIRPDIGKKWIDDMPVSGMFSMEGKTDNWKLKTKIYAESKFSKVEIKGDFRGDGRNIFIEEMTVGGKLRLSGYFGLKPTDDFKIDFSSASSAYAEYRMFFNSKNRMLLDESLIEGKGTIVGNRGGWSLASEYIVNSDFGIAEVSLGINGEKLDAVVRFEGTKFHSLPVKTQIGLTGIWDFDDDTGDFYIDRMEFKSAFLSLGTLIFDDIVGKGRIRERRISVDSLLVDKYIKAKGYFDFNIPSKIDFIFEFEDFQLSYLKKLEMEPSGTKYGGLISGYLQMKGNPSYIYTTGRLKVREGYSGNMKIEDVYINLDGSGSVIDLPNSRAVIDGRDTKIVGFIDLNEQNIFNNVDFALPEKIMNWYNRDTHIN